MSRDTLSCPSLLTHAIGPCSCDPNCVTQRVGQGAAGRILIKARRLIQPGEELAYDYKFSLEDEDSKVPCFCGADNCRGFMN